MDFSMEAVFVKKYQEKNDTYSLKDNQVLLTFDDGYIMQAINLILSLKKNNQSGMSVVCICLSLREEHKKMLLELPCGMMVVYVDILQAFNTGRWSVCTAIRVFAPWLLENLDRVLYLDADIICKGSLDALFSLEVPYIAMCNEINGNVGHSQLKKFRPLFPTEIYCNAGVTVMNLAGIRKEYAFGSAFEAFVRINDEFDYCDQDFLNVFFHKKIVFMNNLHYNLQIYELLNSRLFHRAIYQSKLIHFSVEKPWCYKTDRRIIRTYLAYSEYAPMIQCCRRQLVISTMLTPYRKMRMGLSKMKGFVLGRKDL